MIHKTEDDVWDDFYHYLSDIEQLTSSAHGLRNKEARHVASELDSLVVKLNKCADALAYFEKDEPNEDF